MKLEESLNICGKRLDAFLDFIITIPNIGKKNVLLILE